MPPHCQHSILVCWEGWDAAVPSPKRMRLVLSMWKWYTYPEILCYWGLFCSISAEMHSGGSSKLPPIRLDFHNVAKHGVSSPVKVKSKIMYAIPVFFNRTESLCPSFQVIGFMCVVFRGHTYFKIHNLQFFELLLLLGRSLMIGWRKTILKPWKGTLSIHFRVCLSVCLSVRLYAGYRAHLLT